MRRADPVVAEEAEPADPKKKALTNLSPDEVRALLAVDGSTRSASSRAWKRGRVILLPTGLFQLFAHLFLGSAAPWVMAAIAIGAIVWTAIPLFRKDEWS